MAAVLLLLAPGGARAGSSEPQRAALVAASRDGKAAPPMKRLSTRERWEAATRVANHRAERVRAHAHHARAKGEG